MIRDPKNFLVYIQLYFFDASLKSDLYKFQMSVNIIENSMVNILTVFQKCLVILNFFGGEAVGGNFEFFQIPKPKQNSNYIH